MHPARPDLAVGLIGGGRPSRLTGWAFGLSMPGLRRDRLDQLPRAARCPPQDRFATVEVGRTPDFQGELTQATVVEPGDQPPGQPAGLLRVPVAAPDGAVASGERCYSGLLLLTFSEKILDGSVVLVLVERESLQRPSDLPHQPWVVADQVPQARE